MQRLGRELMTTSEITTMPGDKCILQLRGLPPFLSPKYDLKKHPNYKYTAEFDKKKNAFRLESLFRHRPLRLKPEDEYTVYEVDGSDTDEEADLLNFDDLDSDEFMRNKKQENIAISRKDLLEWLKLLKDEEITDIRKIYKNGVTDSVFEKYQNYVNRNAG